MVEGEESSGGVRDGEHASPLCSLSSSSGKFGTLIFLGMWLRYFYFMEPNTSDFQIYFQSGISPGQCDSLGSIHQPPPLSGSVPGLCNLESIWRRAGSRTHPGHILRSLLSLYTDF